MIQQQVVQISNFSIESKETPPIALLKLCSQFKTTDSCTVQTVESNPLSNPIILVTEREIPHQIQGPSFLFTTISSTTQLSLQPPQLPTKIYFPPSLPESATKISSSTFLQPGPSTCTIFDPQINTRSQFSFQSPTTQEKYNGRTQLYTPAQNTTNSHVRPTFTIITIHTERFPIILIGERFVCILIIVNIGGTF